MADKEVSKIYARALLEIGIENKISQIEEDLASIAGLISGEKDLMLFLNAPVISKDKKKELIDKLFKDIYCTDIVSFLKVLIDNDRQQLLADIYKHFIELLDQLNNRKKIKVITSVRQEPDVLKRIEKIIGDKLNKKIISEEIIDESILGGIIIGIDDMLIDGSLSRNLKNMKTKLLERKVGSGVVYED